MNTVCAHTLENQGPSASILNKLGFQEVGPVVDPEDGPVIRWELARPASA